MGSTLISSRLMVVKKEGEQPESTQTYFFPATNIGTLLLYSDSTEYIDALNVKENQRRDRFH